MTQWTALGLTLAIEVPIVFAWIRFVSRDRDLPAAQLLAVAAAATLVTHPVVWYFNTVVLQPWPFAARAFVLETFAVVVEAAIYARFLNLSVRQATLLSLVANGASFGLGILAWALR